MKYYRLKKGRLDELIDALNKKYKVIGPKAKENLFVYGEIENAKELSLLHKPTILSLKKYFLPQQEDLLNFKVGDVSGKIVEIEQGKPLLVLGAHTCDLAGLLCLDNACNDSSKDANYLKRKTGAVIIGIECSKPCDEHATCITMGTHNPKGGYDIMLTESGDGYIVETASEDGEKLVNETKSAFEDSDKSAAETETTKLRTEKNSWPKKIFPEAKKLEALFDKTLKSAEWGKLGERCVSCGNCTNVCPTCYCYDVKDEVDLKLKDGVRYRIWDSCQLKEFAEVAGNENFRDKRKQRQQHRFLRKFSFPVKKYNRFFCTGCGRCTRACMAKINLYETINALAKETI